MTGKSLRLRLFMAALVSVSLALVLAGFGLTALFGRHVERRVEAELETYLRQLSGGIEFNEDGSFSLGVPMADPRFDAPFSGLYWQVEDDDRHMALHSRSLWDARIDLPPDPLDVGAIHHHFLPGPEGATLLVQERRIVYPVADGERSLRMAVGLDHADLVAARHAFAADIWPSLMILGLMLLAAIWVQISTGLKPLDAIRRGVMAIRSGAARRLAADQPDEVMPLVDEVNDLLTAQEQAVERARMRAGDLAHGLKTPLTVLQVDAQRLRERGQEEIASEIEQLVADMRRHVDQELTRTRLHGKSAGQSAPVGLAGMIERLVRLLERSPIGAAHDWRMDISSDLKVRMEREDLMDLAGNLLDNAAKWARGRIFVSAAASDGHVVLMVEDDGPGVAEDALSRLGERGVRLDQKAPGNGLGLAIVRDIAAAYQGTVEFQNRPAGGLRVAVKLPA